MSRAVPRTNPRSGPTAVATIGDTLASLTAVNLTYSLAQKRIAWHRLRLAPEPPLTAPPSPLPPFLSFPADQVDQYPTALDDIASGAILGVIVRGVYTKEQARTAVERIIADPNPPYVSGSPAYGELDGSPTEIGMALFSSSGALDSYLDTAQKLRVFIDRAMDGMPTFEASMGRVLSALLGGRPATVAPGPDDDRTYTPTTVRVMPCGGGLDIHVGMNLQGLDAAAHLRGNIETWMQFSYFLTLQAVQPAGELVVYGLSWPEAVRRQGEPGFPVRTDVPVQQGEAADYIRALPKVIVRPDPGDLLIFNGGNWYHEVSDPVEGTRYTLGGFMGWRKGRTGLYYWA